MGGLGARGQHEEAVASLEAAVALQPADSRTLFRLGNAHFALQSYGPAEDAFKRAIQASASHDSNMPYFA